MTGIPVQAIFKQIANASDDVYKYVKGSKTQLASSAGYAAKLGIQLNKMAQIGNKVLQFQQSITDQMSASLIIGQRIDLSRTRALFAQGKMTQAMTQMRKQIGGIDLKNLNPFQADALAQAVGMSTKQLMNMDLRQKMVSKNLSTLTDKQKK